MDTTMDLHRGDTDNKDQTLNPNPVHFDESTEQLAIVRNQFNRLMYHDRMLFTLHLQGSKSLGNNTLTIVNFGLPLIVVETLHAVDKSAIRKTGSFPVTDTESQTAAGLNIVPNGGTVSISGNGTTHVKQITFDLGDITYILEPVLGDNTQPDKIQFEVSKKTLAVEA